MQTYILLENNIVINVIKSSRTISEGGWLLENRTVSQGDIYDPDTDTFSAPVTPEITPKPQVSLTNIAITEATLNGAIYWIPTKKPFTLTANVALPDSEMMMIIEQVVRQDNGAYNAISDIRVKASIVSGVVTIQAQFDSSGNYRIKAERLNMGLDEIGAPFNLAFDLIEFDAYAIPPVVVA